MRLSPSQIITIRYQFDSFCRKLLVREGFNFDKMRNRRLKHEICFSGVADGFLDALFVEDNYDIEHTYFDIMDERIYIQNENLAKAIQSLTEEKKNIILLKYFMEMNDREIAEVLQMYRSSVQRKRINTIEELKNKLGVRLYEG